MPVMWNAALIHLHETDRAVRLIDGTFHFSPQELQKHFAIAHMAHKIIKRRYTTFSTWFMFLLIKQNEKWSSSTTCRHPLSHGSFVGWVEMARWQYSHCREQALNSLSSFLNQEVIRLLRYTIYAKEVGKLIIIKHTPVVLGSPNSVRMLPTELFSSADVESMWLCP